MKTYSVYEPENVIDIKLTERELNFLCTFGDIYKNKEFIKYKINNTIFIQKHNE